MWRKNRGLKQEGPENLDGRMVSSPESVCHVFPKLKVKEGTDS